jgi:hypothetical protein
MWLLATTSSIAFTAANLTAHSPAPPVPEMDRVMVFGFLAAFATLVIGPHARQSRSTLAAFTACLAAIALYAFLQGAWPIGFVLGIWAANVLRQCFAGKIRQRGNGFGTAAAGTQGRSLNLESRMSRMFGA